MGFSQLRCPWGCVLCLSDADPALFVLHNVDILFVLLKQRAFCRFETWCLLLRCSVRILDVTGASGCYAKGLVAIFALTPVKFSINGF